MPSLQLLRLELGGVVIAVPVEVAESDLSAPEEVVSGGRHLASIARLPDGLLVIQNLESFLPTTEGDRLDAALAEAAG